MVDLDEIAPILLKLEKALKQAEFDVVVDLLEELKKATNLDELDDVVDLLRELKTELVAQAEVIDLIGLLKRTK